MSLFYFTSAMQRDTPQFENQKFLFFPYEGDLSAPSPNG